MASHPDSAAAPPGPEQGARRTSAFRGCLLGGAVGDAFGAPLEFLPLGAIRARFGPDGIQEFAPAYGHLGAITDDTQMTLFTAEGLLRATVRHERRGICHPPSVVRNAYGRWFRTQDEPLPEWLREEPDGWLIAVPGMHSRRAAGATCLAAMRSDRSGSIEEPLNDSKGCGGVMRIAPVGLVASDPFHLGCEIAALTHGHPSGYLAPGACALMIHLLLRGEDVLFAARAALDTLDGHKGHEETSRALEAALDLAAGGTPSPEAVETLGQGFVAEEALAIAVYAALVSGDDFAAGVRIAVNHSGDSDSTGAIAGNLLGTRLGVEAISTRWLDQLELREEITALADDLVVGYRDDEAWWRRYPGH